MPQESKIERYKHEDGRIVIEVAVKNSRQLFYERDPSPFRERDLDPQFVNHLLSSVQEFPIRTKMKIRILISESEDLKYLNRNIIQDAIMSYFQYESKLAKSKMIKSFRTARYFALIGLCTLIICLTLANYIGSMPFSTNTIEIARAGLIIIGWVAMWHPIESILYDWWPIHEQRIYFDKIANLETEVVSATHHQVPQL